MEAAVESFLDAVREAAAGQLFNRQVISYTIAAYSLFVAAGICAIAISKILFLITFHN